MPPMENGNFEPRRLNDSGFEKAHKVAKSFETALNIIEGECNEGRELPAVRAKLQEAWLLAHDAIVAQKRYQQGAAAKGAAGGR